MYFRNNVGSPLISFEQQWHRDGPEQLTRYQRTLLRRMERRGRGGDEATEATELPEPVRRPPPSRCGRACGRLYAASVIMIAACVGVQLAAGLLGAGPED